MMRAVAAVTTSLALTAVAAGGAVAATPGWTPLTPAEEPAANPLKGFVPFAGQYDPATNTFPHSMEWAYFPLDAVMTGPDTFDWTVFEASLADIASRGHQTALRFYLDYPTRESGIPQFLIDGGLEVRPYDEFNNNGVSVSPDYDDPNLRAALDSFVAALGERYDGDPRIGYVQAGLVGFWGEWHTWPYNGDGRPNWMPSDETQLDILQDFVAAFPTTEIQVRNPNTMNAPLPIGYHDDSFALSTMISPLGWHFMDNMVAAGATEKWQQYSIGGELRPELQPCIFSAAGCPVIEEGGDNDFAGSLEQTHATWLLNHYAFQTGYSEADKPAALAAAQSLGYSFRATEAWVPATTGAGATTIGLTVSNIGVAPFYYDWPISIAYLDATGAVVRSVETDWLISDVASGATEQFVTTVDTTGLPAGDYTVVAQVANPLPGGMPVRFANASQDADVDGWLTLGVTTVAAAGAAPVPGTAGAPELAATGADVSTLLGLAAAVTLLGLAGVVAERRVARR
ncbi:uncharacterized protein DUF4832 [Diaminobutyricimonas aerilata]|uniref:Uncharacterized protein DUF4832 n=2 Tax=Diaminobutyricimonas aerilata TaxID=1162967 RepID=A0A2M9CG36_9MICO|nr:uncharacterized protein DUF4832 [Diaminobutyricimonas aerilata]